MWDGKVESIFIAKAAEAPMEAVAGVRAVPGAGLEGDRYFLKQGTFFKPEPDFELTLIEAEALEAMKNEYKIEVTSSQSRRNIVTRGVPLNHLVGKDFQIGEVRIHGIRLCEPCSHLQKLTDREVIKGLRHRGGLRAQILSEGVLKPGDTVMLSASQEM
jgi:MOSC domain-containing protein YiiM